MNNQTIKKVPGRTLLLILGFIIATYSAIGQIPQRPVPPRLVNDFAGILSESEVISLERHLVAYSDSTSTQITVVIMSDLQGYDIDDMAQRIGQEWGVGQSNTNNGLVILIKPKVNNSPGGAAISTGYGLEDVITDAVSRRIIGNEMIPRFKENKYYDGLMSGLTIISDLLMGKYKAEDYANGSDKKGAGFIILIIFGIFILIGIFGKNKGDNNHTIGRKNDLPFWLLLSMMGNRGGGGGSSGGWGGFSGGSGGFGGGGGFGGFGGGSFGGGGASGSW